MTDRGPLAVQVWEEEAEELRGPRLWEESVGVWKGTETCVYSRLLAGMGLIWWADVTNESGEMESVKGMEERTGRAWSEAERTEYKRLKGHMESAGVRESDAGRRWRMQCARWAEMGRKPMSNVRGDDPVQRLRQRGWVWDVEGIEGARVAPKGWGGWEYLVRWTGGNVSWEKGIEMPKGRQIQAEMERARKRQRSPDGFREVVMRAEKLRRACGMNAGGDGMVTERDMKELWAAFVRYVEEITLM